MSTADGKHTGNPGAAQVTAHLVEKDSIGVVTLAANMTLTAQYRRYLKLDPGGSARDVNLPAEATSNGLSFEIANAADAAENLVVKDDGGSTIVTIGQNEKASVHCDGSAWYHMGIITIALS